MSQINDISFSQINSFYEASSQSSNENLECLKEIDEIVVLPSQITLTGERSFVDGIIENFEVEENSKLNLSLCDFDDTQIGNGNSKILEFYQENELKNISFGF